MAPSGVQEKRGELVFYAVPVDHPDTLPDVHFGVMAGLRDAKGLTALVVTNETTGSAEAPGFNAVTGGMTVKGIPVPSFGYYAGPAAKITATVAGRQVRAHQATWSQDLGIVFFWFDSAADPARLTAVDAAGRTLPTGRTGVGHG